MDGAHHDKGWRSVLAACLLLCLVMPLAQAMEAADPLASPDAVVQSAEDGSDDDAVIDEQERRITAGDHSTTTDPDKHGPVIPEKVEEGDPDADPCSNPEQQALAMVDRVQRGVYLGVCGAAQWFDGLFGTRRYDQDSDATYGRLGLSEIWDDRDGLRTRVRLRARFALPTAKRRLKLLLGRTDDREVEQDTQFDTSTQLPSSFNNVEDDSWLLGLGYSKQGAMKNGFDFGAGIKLRTPVDPYVKGTYRHNIPFGDDVMLRARQTIFWRDKRGLGETTEISLDKLLNDHLLLRWENGATLAKDLGRLEWFSGLVLFQSLGDHRGLSYTGFVRGIANTDVPVRDYGVELRYRVRVLREWLFLEGRSSLTWPRESLGEDRDINPGVALGFEMYFGPVPAAEMR